MLADLIRDRRLARVLVLCGAAQAGFVFLGWPGWPCPVQSALGLPCPGCGLSRATAALLRGNWLAAFALHPFAPLVLAMLALLAVAALAPRAVVDQVADTLRVVEARTRLTSILVAAFLAHGLIRFVLAMPVAWRASLGS